MADSDAIPSLIDPEPPDIARLRERAAAAMEPFSAQDFARWEEEAVFPEEVFEAIRDAGLLGLCMPERFGGAGRGVLEACTVIEELSYAGGMAPGLICQMFVNGPPRAILELGTDEQRARYLPDVVAGRRYFAIAMTETDAGSAATELETRLEPDGTGFRLMGSKCYITSGYRADSFLVFCRGPGTRGGRGIGAVVVERGQPGFAVTEGAIKMGGNAIGEADLDFDGVPIARDAVIVMPNPGSSEGAAMMLRQFGPERCGNAAMVLGVARAALMAAIQHARTRRQFGREIAEFQGLQWKLADMAMRLDAARLLVHRAATSDEGGFPITRYTMAAKIFANEAAEFICREAIQIHGHRGYTREYPLERWYREVRGASIGGGTSETARNVLAAEVIGRRFSQRAPR